MRIYRTKNYEEMSRKAADLIAAQMIMKPDAVLGLATGSTPLGAYRLLVERYQKGELDFSEISSVNLDEYVGLSAADVQSYAYFMRTNLFDKVNIMPENTHIPNGLETDHDLECSRYDRVIAALGGIDLQILGIGSNGHIGFNEPGDAFIPGTQCVKLAESTIQANARFFTSPDEVPTAAYSMGIRSILQARAIVLMASGKAKAHALYQALYGPITPSLPASILQLHNNVYVVADKEALSDGSRTF